MKIIINQNSNIPIYQQIALSIEHLIETQELVRGTKLPTERQLATQLQVHRNTIIRAYGELIDKGLVQASRKKPKGYFVVSYLEQNFSQRFFPLEKAFRYEFRRAEKKFNRIYWESDDEHIISFGGMIMDKKIHIAEGIEGAMDRIINMARIGGLQSFIQETGRLKENLCKTLATQNIFALPKNIQIVAETNQAIGYLMMLYVREGDCIIAEEPIIPDVSSIFYNRGINVVTVPMDNDGMNLEILEKQVCRYKPKFIYTMPNFHNPTGIRMSLNKRQRLLELANDYNVPIIEDDYLCDFQYVDKSIPSLYALDFNKLVVYVNSFTLTFPYGVKTGFVVGPPDFIDMLGYAINIDETMIGNASQFLINEYMENNSYEQNMKSLQQYYHRKRDLVCAQLDKIRDKGITYNKPDGGLVIWCTLHEEINERLLCKTARSKSVIVTPGWVFFINKKKEAGHIRLCFSNISDDKIVEGIMLLGQALDECRGKETAKDE